MHFRKNWSKQEDEQLLNLIYSHSDQQRKLRRLKWNQIAGQLNTIIMNKVRNGKQCRQRWYGQLNPELNNNQPWSKQSEKVLFGLQELHGNQWVKISTFLPGKSDNNVKNYFYSFLRRSFRMMITYLSTQKKRKRFQNIKLFQQSNLNKILSVAENKSEKKIIVMNKSVYGLAKEIKLLLIEMQRNQEQNYQQKQENLQNAVLKIIEFNKNCKKKKQKKIKCYKNEYKTQRQASCIPNLGKKTDYKMKQVQQKIQFNQKANPDEGYQCLHAGYIKEEEQQGNKIIFIQRTQRKTQQKQVVKEEEPDRLVIHNQNTLAQWPTFYGPKLFPFLFPICNPQANDIFYHEYPSINDISMTQYVQIPLNTHPMNNQQPTMSMQALTSIPSRLDNLKRRSKIIDKTIQYN